MSARLEPPPLCQEAMDWASDLDRAYFRRHPRARQYRRPQVQGEFWPASAPPGTAVDVILLAPGVRARIPVLASGARDDAERWN